MFGLGYGQISTPLNEFGLKYGRKISIPFSSLVFCIHYKGCPQPLFISAETTEVQLDLVRSSADLESPVLLYIVQGIGFPSRLQDRSPNRIIG